MTIADENTERDRIGQISTQCLSLWHKYPVSEGCPCAGRQVLGEYQALASVLSPNSGSLTFDVRSQSELAELRELVRLSSGAPTVNEKAIGTLSTSSSLVCCQ